MSVLSSSNMGYAPYSSTYKNTVTNYSSYVATSTLSPLLTLTQKPSSSIPPPYRFSTFCWNADTGLNSIATNTFNFLINNFKVNGNLVTSANLQKDTSGCYCYTADNGTTLDNRLLIHYRVEDAGSILPTDANSASTVWVDGNSNFSSDSNGFIIGDTASITSAIYFTNNSAKNLVKYTSSSYAMINSNLQINLNTILYKKSNASIIYFRIGLPTNNRYSFSNVSLSLS